MEPSGLTEEEFALALKIDQHKFQKIVAGSEFMDYSFIWRLACYTSTEIRFWHFLQMEYQFFEYKKSRDEKELEA
jgi:plasmid maintenance system antidote protein VapI